MKRRVGVIFGGRSGEHDISIRSATTVIENIDSEKYDVVPVAITAEGQWLSPARSLEEFPAATRSKFVEAYSDPSSEAVALTGDSGARGMTLLEGSGGTVPIDVIFPVLH